MKSPCNAQSIINVRIVLLHVSDRRTGYVILARGTWCKYGVHSAHIKGRQVKFLWKLEKPRHCTYVRELPYSLQCFVRAFIPLIAATGREDVQVQARASSVILTTRAGIVMVSSGYVMSHEDGGSHLLYAILE